MPELEPKKNKPHFEAALQLRGFPAGTTALLPCPARCLCGCTPRPGLVAAKCAACGADVVQVELALGMPGLVVACWPCLRGAHEDAQRLKGAPQ